MIKIYREMKKRGKITENILCLAAVAVGLYVVSRIFGYICPVRRLTGFSCPGCGMTRAWTSFIKGDIRDAFYYHPLFPLAVPIVLFPFLEQRLDKKVFNAVIIVIALLFAVVYIIRMASGSPVLDRDFHNGLIWRSLHDGINWIMRQR